MLKLNVTAETQASKPENKNDYMQLKTCSKAQSKSNEKRY